MFTLRGQSTSARPTALDHLRFKSTLRVIKLVYPMELSADLWHHDFCVSFNPKPDTFDCKVIGTNSISIPTDWSRYIVSTVKFAPNTNQFFKRVTQNLE
jgi:hypothetical protein